MRTRIENGQATLAPAQDGRPTHDRPNATRRYCWQAEWIINETERRLTEGPQFLTKRGVRARAEDYLRKQSTYSFTIYDEYGHYIEYAGRAHRKPKGTVIGQGKTRGAVD